MIASEIWSKHVPVNLNDIRMSDTARAVIEQLVSDYLPIDHEDHLKMHALAANKGAIIKYVAGVASALTYEQADALLYTVDSFNRPGVLIALDTTVCRTEWLKLFREYWAMCDSCSIYYDSFIEILSSYSLDNIKSVTHTEDDISFYDSLPETFEVYRGTFIDDRFAGGISWTTDRSVAERFAAGYTSFAEGGLMAMRYRINLDNDTFELLKDIATSGTTVLTRTVKKSDIFVNTSRNESEILVIN